MSPSISVSIIVPLYNAEQYVARALKSVICQTYENINLLIVDDCSTDNSVCVVENYLRANNYCKYNIIRQAKNSGPSNARNIGLSVASTDYVYFLDSDDELSKDCIEKLIAPLCEVNYDFVVGGYRTERANASDEFVFPYEKLCGENVIRAFSEGKINVMPWNKLCKRSFLLANNLFFDRNICVHEDYIWTYKLVSKAKLAMILPNITYCYKVRESSLMTSLKIAEDVNWYIEAFKAIQAFVQEEGNVKGAIDYKIIEGKKSGILYSLLQIGDEELYRKAYADFRLISYFDVKQLYRQGWISLMYLLRDLHYMLPPVLGSMYKKAFYLIVYKWRGRKIEGAIWG